MGRYVYDQQWQDERRRLAGIEALWDPGTFALLERLGVARGWRCWEVGAGGGSVSEWLARRVGRDGRVVATDVHTKFLGPLAEGGVEVREHDVLADEPPEPDFDLVYSRLVVEHLGTPALVRMSRALRPGGLLVLEDYDFRAATAHPPNPLFERVLEAVLGFMREAGFDPHYGRRLPAELRAAGLEDIGAEGRVRLFAGGEPDTVFFRLSLESLRAALVAAGSLADSDAEEALARLDDPANTFVSPTMVAAWGRRPGGK